MVARRAESAAVGGHLILNFKARSELICNYPRALLALRPAAKARKESVFT